MGMNVKVRKTTKYSVNIDIDGEDVDLPLEGNMSPAMDFTDPFTSLSPDGTRFVLAYLVDDSDCENPLTSSDANGAVYTRRRDAPKEELDAFRAAFGLDSSGEPRVDEEALRSRYEAYFVAHATVEQCEDIGIDREPGESDEAFIRRAARVDFDYDETDLLFQDAHTDILNALHQEAIDDLAVPLDVYEHGGISYSLSGEGMQDRFDTARCGAVWVPDDMARDEIRYASIKALLPAGTCVQYVSTKAKSNDITYSLPDGTQQGGFTSFAEAIEAAAAALSAPLDETVIRPAMQAAAREYARPIVAEYTQWCNGETYGFVVNEYKKTDDEEWEIARDESCYGFIGSDAAEDEMRQGGRAVATWDKLATNEDDNDVASPAP